ncbi:hypothetical protein DE146DRAFT_398087 [Phaeosphaeria sp. MPI-PUGE-AT-0046c]|nr:hypothetical protein DE146DRAFT_398087 [Phaeosphaeria sp. MPI-PUGE-AT-0046c]
MSLIQRASIPSNSAQMSGSGICVSFVRCALHRSNNQHKNTKAQHSLAHLLIHHIFSVQHNMANYRSHDYESSDISNRGLRAFRCNHDQQHLVFLSDFDDSDIDEMDHKHEEEKLMCRRRVVYRVILLIAWLLFAPYWMKYSITTFNLVTSVYYLSEIISVIYAVCSPAVAPRSTALERRSSSVPVDFAPACHSSPQNRRPRSVASKARFTGRAEPHSGMQRDDRPLRLWNEALYDAWQHIREDLKMALLYRVPYILMHTSIFLVIFQVLITFMQTIGVHFREGQDTVGVINRCFANLSSTQNLFGVGGIAGVGALWASRARWWWDLIVLVAGKVWMFFIDANTIPGEGMSEEQLRAAGVIPVWGETANTTASRVR